MIVSILGKNVRANLHGDALRPVIAVWDGERTAYGLGALLHQGATLHYDPHSTHPHGECWLEAGAVTLYPFAITPPSAHGYFIHTNTHHAKRNRQSLRAGRDAPLQPVFAVRHKRHAPAQFATQLQTQGALWLVYACSQNALKPLPCGARVWGFTVVPPLLDGVPCQHAHPQNLF